MALSKNVLAGVSVLGMAGGGMLGYRDETRQDETALGRHLRIEYCVDDEASPGSQITAALKECLETNNDPGATGIVLWSGMADTGEPLSEVIEYDEILQEEVGDTDIGQILPFAVLGGIATPVLFVSAFDRR